MCYTLDLINIREFITVFSVYQSENVYIFFNNNTICDSRDYKYC